MKEFEQPQCRTHSGTCHQRNSLTLDIVQLKFTAAVFVLSTNSRDLVRLNPKFCPISRLMATY